MADQLLVTFFFFFDFKKINEIVICVSHRYMGIGLSAQGVNMNRLPGKMSVCAFALSQYSLPLPFGCGEKNLSVCVFHCLYLLYIIL